MEPQGPLPPTNSTGQSPPVATCISRSKCVLHQLSVLIPDTKYQSLEAQGRALAQLFKSFGFTFFNNAKREEVATTLVTALISETRLSEKELFMIQDSLHPTTWEPDATSPDRDPPLFGISISCTGGIEVSVDPLNPLSSRLTRTHQEIQLRHVEVEDDEQSSPSWEKDPDAWRDADDSEDIEWTLSEIFEIENPTMSLKQSSDPTHPGIVCSILFDTRLNGDSSDHDWRECDSFLMGAKLPKIPENLDASWTVERDPLSAILKASNGLYTIDFQLVEPGPQHESATPQLSDLAMPTAEWQDIRLAKSGEVCLTNPPLYALEAICRDIGVPEVTNVVLKTNFLSTSGDNPTCALAPMLASLRGGGLTINEHHLLDSSQLESRTSAYITLEYTPVGALHIETSLGRFLHIAVFPPTPSPGDEPDIQAFQKDQILRAAKIPWGMIAARAREFSEG